MVQMVAGILAFVLLDTVERRSLALLRDAMASFGKGDHAERDNVIDSLQEMVNLDKTESANPVDYKTYQEALCIRNFV